MDLTHLRQGGLVASALWEKSKSQQIRLKCVSVRHFYGLTACLILVQREGVVHAVHLYLDGDAAAREMLTIDVINVRAFARWLIKTHDWDASEAAVSSALRRYPRKPSQGVFADAREVLANGYINSRSNVWSLHYTDKRCVRQLEPRLYAAVDPSRAELLRIVEGDTASKVIVSGKKVEEVQAILKECELVEAIGNLAEFSIICPGPELRKTPGVVALMLNTLTVNRINIRETVTGAGELLVLVHNDDALGAWQVLSRLCSKGGTGAPFDPPRGKS